MSPDAEVRFDADLIPGMVDATNWSLRWMGQRFGMMDAQVGRFGPNGVGFELQLPPTPDPGRDEFIFTPPPFDVLGLDGGPVQPFVLENFV